MGCVRAGGVRHEASVPSPASQWSVGALRQSPPRSLLLPGKGVLWLDTGQGSLGKPGPILAPLPYLLVLIVRVAIVTA